MLHEGFGLEIDEVAQGLEVVIEKLLAEVRGQVSLRVIEKRGDIVLQRALAAALIVEEVRLAAGQHDVAGLKVAIEEVISGRAQQKFREAAEIVFQRLLAEGDAGEAQEVVLEIVEIPGNRLAVEASARIAQLVVQVAAGLDLKARKSGDDFAVGVGDLRADDFSLAVLREQFEERGVAEVLFEIRALVEVFAVDLGNGQAVLAEVAGEFEECDVLFAHSVEYADGADAFRGEADNLSAGASEFSLHGLY